MQKTACDGVPGKTEKEIEFGTLDENIIWTCTDGLNGGSICAKSCAANHFSTISVYNGATFQVNAFLIV